MVYSGEQDGRLGFPRLRELLPEVHSGLFRQSSTPSGLKQIAWTSLQG